MQADHPLEFLVDLSEFALFVGGVRRTGGVTHFSSFQDTTLYKKPPVPELIREGVGRDPSRIRGMLAAPGAHFGMVRASHWYDESSALLAVTKLARRCKANLDEHEVLALDASSGREITVMDPAEDDVIVFLLRREPLQEFRGLVQRWNVGEGFSMALSSTLGMAELQYLMKMGAVQGPIWLLEFFENDTLAALVTDQGIAGVHSIGKGVEGILDSIEDQLSLKIKGSAKRLLYSSSYDFRELGERLIEPLTRRLEAVMDESRVKGREVVAFGIDFAREWIEAALVRSIGLESTIIPRDAVAEIYGVVLEDDQWALSMPSAAIKTLGAWRRQKMQKTDQNWLLELSEPRTVDFSSVADLELEAEPEEEEAPAKAGPPVVMLSGSPVTKSNQVEEPSGTTELDGVERETPEEPATRPEAPEGKRRGLLEGPQIDESGAPVRPVGAKRKKGPPALLILAVLVLVLGGAGAGVYFGFLNELVPPKAQDQPGLVSDGAGTSPTRADVAAAPETFVAVGSEPQGARFVLTGEAGTGAEGFRLEGETPEQIHDVPLGSYLLRVEYAEFTPYEQVITISDELPNGVAFAEFQVGNLQILSGPIGATIKFDGEVVGTTPIELRDIEAKEYEVEVSFTGYVPQKRMVRVLGGDIVIENFQLEPRR